MNLRKEFDKLKTPDELMEFMNKYIKYGWIGKDNILRISTIQDFTKQYRVSTLEEVLQTGIGICFEQVALEKEFFARQNIKTETFSIFTTHMCHAFLLYEKNHIFYKFEHSSSKCRGIFSYDTKEDLLRAEVDSFCERHSIKNKEKVCLVLYNEIQKHATIQEIKQLFQKKENRMKKLTIQ